MWLLAILALLRLGLFNLGEGEQMGASLASGLIHLLVLITGTWGMFRLSWLLAQLSVEHSVAHTIRAASDEQVRSQRAGLTEPIPIENVPNLWPVNPSRGLVSLSLCEAILVDGIDRQFASRDVLIGQAREKIEDTAFVLRAPARLALHFGILGTFLGLAFSLPELARIGGGNYQEASFSALFNALGACFTTSVTGIVASLVLNLGSWLGEGAGRRALEAVEAAARATSVIVRNSSNRHVTARALDEVSLALERLHGDLEGQRERTDAQTDAIQEGLASLRLARADLDSFLEGIAELRDQVLKDIQVMVSRLDGNRFEKDLELRLESVGQSLARMVEASVDGACQALATSADSLQVATETQKGLASGIRSSAQALDVQLTLTREGQAEVERGLRSVTEEISGVLKERFGEVSSVLTRGALAYRKSLDELQGERQEFVSDQAGTIGGISKAVSSIVDELIGTVDRLAQQQREFLGQLREKAVDEHLEHALSKSLEDLYAQVAAGLEQIETKRRSRLAARALPALWTRLSGSLKRSL